MRLEQLEYIIEIAKQNSMSAASEHLYLTPQTLSVSMRNLEKKMGFLIFDRTSKGATLTENGKRVLKFAMDTVNEYYNIVAQCSEKPVSPVQSDLQGTLHIYANPSFSISLLPHYTRMFLNLYPNVKVSISSGTIPDICNQLNQARIKDPKKSVLGIANIPCYENTILTDPFPEDTQIYQKTIDVSRYLCCVSQCSPLAKQQVVHVKKLLKSPLVMYSASGDPGTPLIYILQRYQEHLNIALEVPSISFWAQAVHDNIGVGFINSMILDNVTLDEVPYLEGYLNKLVFVKTKESLFYANSFLYHSEPDPIMKAFMDLWPTYHPKKNEPEFNSICIIASQN